MYLYICILAAYSRVALSFSRAQFSSRARANARGGRIFARSFRSTDKKAPRRPPCRDGRESGVQSDKKKCLEGEAAERDSRGSGGNGGGGDGDGDGRGGEDDDGNIEGQRGLGVNEHVDGVGRGKGEPPPFLTLPPPPPPLSFDSCDYCC